MLRMVDGSDGGKLPVDIIRSDYDLRNLEIKPVTRYGHVGVTV